MLTRGKSQSWKEQLATQFDGEEDEEMIEEIEVDPDSFSETDNDVTNARKDHD